MPPSTLFSIRIHRKYATTQECDHRTAYAKVCHTVSVTYNSMSTFYILVMIKD
jgi:hypothetical protein